MTAKENLIAAIKHKNPEWVPNGMEKSIRLYPPILERTLNEGKDVFGCEWAFAGEAEGGTYPTEKNLVITDITKWKEQLHIPDVNQFDWSYVRHQVENIDREEYVLEGFCEMGLFERSYLLMGMDNALVNYMLEPELMYDMLSVLADYKVDFISKFDDEIGLDMIWYGDDWGTQRNLFVSPEIWRQIIRPNTRKIYDCMKERHLIINQHSCGKIDSIFGDLVEMGADIWNLCQPCNDLAGLKKKYSGSIAFHGGIDSQFILNNPDATPEMVKKEVKKRIDEMGEGGGYIAGASHMVPNHRPDIINAYNEAVDEYGTAIYSK